MNLRLRQVDAKPAGRELTPNIHSRQDLNRPEAKRFRVELANLNIPKIDPGGPWSVL